MRLYPVDLNLPGNPIAACLLIWADGQLTAYQRPRLDTPRAVWTAPGTEPRYVGPSTWQTTLDDTDWPTLITGCSTCCGRHDPHLADYTP